MSTDDIAHGTRRVIDGELRGYYYGYWIKAYEVPKDSLSAKRRLIESLTRRLFNHTEHGLNIPGTYLDQARAAYEAETDPAKRRIKGGMLAGTLFNRATDIFTKLVELEELGVSIQSDNALLRQCGACLHEALQLGKLVLHRSGEEGIDELWGEPFRAFSIPLDEFYESRYVKISLTMRDIDRIADTLVATFAQNPMFPDIEPSIRAYARAARDKCETLRTDPDIFEIWSDFVVARERLTQRLPVLPEDASATSIHEAEAAHRLISAGADLITYITRARVPMPKSTREYVERCDRHTRYFLTTS